jgi:hypothetical protein
VSPGDRAGVRERAVAAAEGWRVLLPPGWVTLPTEPDAAARAIARHLDRALRGKPRDELVDVRIELDRALRAQVRRAAKAGARHVHALAEPVRGLPVSASLVTRQVATQHPDQLAPVLNAMFGQADGIVENGYADLADRGALRRVRRWDASQEAPGSGSRTATSVDFVVPMDDGSVLVMAFSTMTEPVHRELVVLFDAIATTLHPAVGGC